MSYIPSGQCPTSSSSTQINHTPPTSAGSSVHAYTLSDEAIQSLLKESILDYSLTEIRHLEESKKLVKNLEGNQSENYLRLKALMLDVRMAHLPLRSYQLWKKGTYNNIAHRGTYVQNDFFRNRDPKDKQARKRAKADLFELCASPKIQERLKLLSRITFLHGSNSAALAMMHGSSEPSLRCTGSLFAEHITPMSGANDDGISSTGINLTKISTETTRDVSRILHYTQGKPFDPSNVHLLNPYSTIVAIEDLPLLGKALEKWKNEHPEEFAQNFSLGSLKRQQLTECLKSAISTIESEKLEMLSAFDDPEEFNNVFGFDISECPDPEMLEMMKSDMSLSANGAISALLTLTKLLESGDDFSADLSTPQQTDGLVTEDHYLNQLRYPFLDRSKEKSWNGITIRILQLKQWDHQLFVNHILPFSAEWTAAINQEYAFFTNRLTQILKIMEHEFTEEEITFINNITSPTNTSTNELPVGLQAIFTSANEIGKYGNIDSTIPLVQNLRSNYLVSKDANWRKFIRYVINEKIKHHDFAFEKSAIIKTLKTVEMCYQNIIRALSNEPAPYQIPQDPIIRSLITQPAPIVFASTTVKPAPLHGSEFPSEFVLHTPTKLGRGGCDVIFTDTEESVDRIKLLLPQNVVEEIQFHLFDDLDVNGAPLVHSPDQIDSTNYEIPRF